MNADETQDSSTDNSNPDMPIDTGKGEEGGDMQYLEAIVENLSPAERTQLQMLLEKYTKKDRTSGTLSLDEEGSRDAKAGAEENGE